MKHFSNTTIKVHTLQKYFNVYTYITGYAEKHALFGPCNRVLVKIMTVGFWVYVLSLECIIFVSCTSMVMSFGTE
jgi:hypothetical protein